MYIGNLLYTISLLWSKQELLPWDMFTYIFVQFQRLRTENRLLRQRIEALEKVSLWQPSYFTFNFKISSERLVTFTFNAGCLARNSQYKFETSWLWCRCWELNPGPSNCEAWIGYSLLISGGDASFSLPSSHIKSKMFKDYHSLNYHAFYTGNCAV